MWPDFEKKTDKIDNREFLLLFNCVMHNPILNFSSNILKNQSRSEVVVFSLPLKTNKKPGWFALSLFY